MQELNQPATIIFSQRLQEAVQKQEYVRLHYYSEWHELLKVASVAKRLLEIEGTEMLELASGEIIPVNKLVRLGEMPAPGHGADDFYNCSCG